jgi:hypothetical protein
MGFRVADEGDFGVARFDDSLAAAVVEGCVAGFVAGGVDGRANLLAPDQPCFSGAPDGGKDEKCEAPFFSSLSRA